MNYQTTTETLPAAWQQLGLWTVATEEPPALVVVVYRERTPAAGAEACPARCPMCGGRVAEGECQACGMMIDL